MYFVKSDAFFILGIERMMRREYKRWVGSGIVNVRLVIFLGLCLRFGVFFYEYIVNEVRSEGFDSYI